MFDDTISCVINAVSLSIPAIIPYMLWFNRRNIYAHILFPSIFIAYVIPIFYFKDDFFKFDSYSLYTEINLYGCIAFLCGVVIARYMVRPVSIKMLPFYQHSSPYADSYRDSYNVLQKRVFIILALGSFLMIISYVGMGFVPMFANDPLSAKFFRGDYQESYRRVAVLFRTGNALIPVFLPLAIILLKENFNIKLFVIVIISFLCIALSLQRGFIGFSLLTALLIYASYKSRRYFLFIFIVYVFIYIFGAALWWILGLAYANADGFFEGAMAGSPDIPDQLNFLSKFLMNSSFTYGRTFIGGLLPFGYEWNPSVYALRILNNVDDISGITSGGLRLPIYLWGYVSFSWLGVFFVSMLCGFLTTHMIMFMKKRKDLTMPFFLLNYIYASTILAFFVNFYSMSIYSLPNMFFVFIIYYTLNWKLKISTR